MNHDRSLVFSLLIDEGEIKSLREIEINLDSRELMLSAYRIFEHKVELRSIECCFTWDFFVVEIKITTDVSECSFGSLPDFFTTEIFLFVFASDTERYSVAIEHPHRLVEDLDNLDYRRDLRLQLTDTTKQMPIILSDRTHTSQSGKLSCLLISIDRRRFEISDRHITIGELIICEELHMMRTIHWLEIEVFITRPTVHFEHIIEVMLRMTRHIVEIFFGNMWRPDTTVAFVFVQ